MCVFLLWVADSVLGFELCYMLGAVELEKLPLKKDAFKKLKLPIDVKSGKQTSMIKYKRCLVLHLHNSTIILATT